MPPRIDRPSHDYIGAGYAFPIRTNVQGSIQLSDETPNLEESIKIILGTKLGERVYRPDFGCRLAELVFEPMNIQTMLLIRLHIEEALETWEPRIALREIITIPDPTSGQVDIEIIYTPAGSHDSRSMVYPFYLLPPEE